MTIPSGPVMFQLRTIFDDSHAVILIWRSFERTASSAVDRNYDSALGDGANWRFAWNCVRIDRSRSSYDRRTRILRASTGWAWTCNHGRIADTWVRDPRPLCKLRVAISETVPAEWSSRPYLEEYEDDSCVSRKFILSWPWSPDASLDDRELTWRYFAITKISKFFLSTRRNMRTDKRSENRDTSEPRFVDSRISSTYRSSDRIDLNNSITHLKRTLSARTAFDDQCLFGRKEGWDEGVLNERNEIVCASSCRDHVGITIEDSKRSTTWN